MRSAVTIGLAVIGLAAISKEASAIPPWARKYNMPCAGCHYPAAPRLNTTGQQFRWAGYRMPNEMNERQVVEQIGNFVSMRGRFRYTTVQSSGSPTTSGFNVNDVTLFYAGSVLERYAGFIEIEREAEDDIALTAHFQGQWGSANSFWGLRGGPMHWIQRAGVAGFDRPTGISTPLAFSAANTAGTNAVPFRINKDQIGLEGFYVRGRNRLSAQVLNGINRNGGGTGGDTEDAAKDFVVTYSRIFDNVASGLTAMAYYGTLGRDTGSATPRHFMRLAASANKVWNDNELIAGATYARDNDLGATNPSITGQAFFVGVQRFFRSNDLAVFGRFDYLEPNGDAANDQLQAFTLGAVLPVGNPAYFRLALEGSVTSYEDPTRNSVSKLVAEVMLNF